MHVFAIFATFILTWNTNFFYCFNANLSYMIFNHLPSFYDSFNKTWLHSPSSLYIRFVGFFAIINFTLKIIKNDQKYSCINLQTIECVNEDMIYIFKLANMVSLM